MKILSVSALFPPHAHGGAEQSAANLARWLATLGHEMLVLAASIADQGDVIEPWREVNVIRRNFPRPYPVFDFPVAPQWKKPLWHLQDSLDPRNRGIVGRVLDQVQPDAVLVHYVPGIGYNTLDEISARGLPTVYYLHDLGLACNRMSMFKSGRDCGSPCADCRVGSAHRLRRLARFERLGFCSPSLANLERLKSLLPMSAWPSTVIPNANLYPLPTVARMAGTGVLRLLYVGRLHPQKGVDVALEAVAALAGQHALQMRVVGGGQSEAELRARFGGEPWCSFTGHVSPSQVSDEMNNADLLLLPSVWLENAPGVAIQALALGLPIFGSRIGGIPEIVQHDSTGWLLPPGDVTAWTDALRQLLADPGRLLRWRASAAAQAPQYEQEALGRRHLAFIEQVMTIKRLSHAS